MGVLAPHHACDNVAHAVVVADLLVLIPRGVLPGLGRPLPGTVGSLKGVGQKAAAGRAGDDLVAVVGDGGVVAEAAALLAVDGGAHGLGGVLNVPLRAAGVQALGVHGLVAGEAHGDAGAVETVPLHEPCRHRAVHTAAHCNQGTLFSIS